MLTIKVYIVLSTSNLIRYLRYISALPDASLRHACWWIKLGKVWTFPFQNTSTLSIRSTDLILLLQISPLSFSLWASLTWLSTLVNSPVGYIPNCLLPQAMIDNLGTSGWSLRSMGMVFSMSNPCLTRIGHGFVHDTCQIWSIRVWCGSTRSTSRTWLIFLRISRGHRKIW